MNSWFPTHKALLACLTSGNTNCALGAAGPREGHLSGHVSPAPPPRFPPPTPGGRPGAVAAVCARVT